MPNHYVPWTAAWGDGVMAAGLLCLLIYMMVSAPNGFYVSWVHIAIVTASCAIMSVQLLAGKMLFSGDAVVAVFYLGLWLAAVLLGRLISATGNGLNTLFSAWLFAALLSVGLALVQWTGAINLDVYSVTLQSGMRPFANLSQPNNFSTLCFLGLCALFWLHQFRRVNGPTFWLGTGFLLLGMVASQSRTGWLQIGLLIVWALGLRTRASLRITRTQLLILGTVFATGIALWPSICDALLLSRGRLLDDQMKAGMRLPYWQAMLDAIGREPLWGYGWQQVGAAQQSVALDHPFIGDYFEHGHNLMLDLILWNGIPAGGLIMAALIWWFISRIRACRDARDVWLLAAVGGVFTHSMLELPLEYAYFLIPVGFAMGAIDGLHPSVDASLHAPRWAISLFSALLTSVFLVMAIDYLTAEENYRVLRLESAHIGVGRLVTPAPKLRLLTQLESFLQFARIEAKPDMSPDQVDWMRKVSERFGYPPVLFRYALAAGLNGQPEVAGRVLARICRIHPAARCVEARDGWLALQLQYPRLAIIALPDPNSGK